MDDFGFTIHLELIFDYSVTHFHISVILHVYVNIYIYLNSFSSYTLQISIFLEELFLYLPLIILLSVVKLNILSDLLGWHLVLSLSQPHQKKNALSSPRDPIKLCAFFYNRNHSLYLHGS